MKNLKNSIFNAGSRLLLALASVLSITVTKAQITSQLSGNYTINNSIAPSATNFGNLYSFVRSLQGLTRSDTPDSTLQYTVGGISASVTVTYSTNTAEVVTSSIPAITGVSSSKTITVNGNGYTSTFSSSNSSVSLTGADYFTFKNLTIQNTASTPGGFWFNNQSDNNTITGCNVYFSNLTTANASVSYISFSTSVSSPTSYGTAATGTTGQPGSNNTITSCKFYTQSGSPGPYYAITLNGNSSNYTATAQNNTFSGNTISNFNYAAVYMYYTNGNQVLNNDISRSNATSGGQTTLYGLYSYYPYCTSRSSSMSGNTIHDLPYNGATLATTNLASFYLTYIYYATGTAANTFKITGNTFKNIYASTSTLYTNYVYYPTYIDITNNVIDNIQSSGTSATWYNWYIYYPTGVKCNGNTIKNCISNYYLYNFYIYYGSVGSYAFNEFCDNVITNNVSVNYMYNAYLYYYNGTNHWRANRNYVVGNKCTGTTAYMYFYIYYAMNYEVVGNVVAGNFANSQYFYIYSGNSGYTAEIRNNTFQADMSNVPTPGSSYLYGYFYLYYHTVRFTGNIIDFKGPSSGTLPYYRYLYMYLSYATPANLLEFDNNTYSLNNNFQYPYWYFNGTNYTDWTGFKGSAVNGPNDNGDDPKFIDKVNNDWRAGGWTMQNNVPYLAINSQDAFKVNRNKTRHDRGGLETQTDLVAVSTNFTVPSIVCAGYTTGSTTLTVKSLYAYDKATNFNVSYSVNGGSKVSAKVTKQLANGDTAIVTFPKPLMLNQLGNNRITIFVDLPDDNNSNDTFVFNTFVKPAPGGGRYIPSTKPTWAYYQASKPNDVTVLKQPVIYTSPCPRVYANSNYGSKWTATAYAVTAGGNARPASEVSYTAPSGGNDLEVQYKTSDASMEDSTIWICLKVTDLGNGCDTTIKRQVLIYPTIVPKFGYPAKICDGDAVIFENKSTVRSGNMEFMWTFGTGKPSDVSEQQDPQFTFPTSGTYKVIMKATTQPYGFPSWDSAMVTVGPVPAVDFDKTNACEGKALTFTNQTTPSTVTFSWNFGDNTTSTLKNPTHTYTKTGAYKVSLTASLNGCLSTVTQYAYQFDKPVAGWNYVSGTCDNDEFVLNNTSTIKNGLFGSFWNLTGGDVSTDVNPHHMFNSPGNKSVKLVVTSEFGCKDSMTKTLNVKESPKVTFTNTPACSLIATQFINQTPPVSGTIANYDWDFGDGSTSKAVSPSHNWSSLGPKTITLTVQLDNSCQSTYSREINVLTQPKADFKALSVCSGSPVVFENNTTWAQGDINYNWNFADGAQSTASDPLHDYGTVTKTSTYMVTLYANIVGGCSDSVTKPVTVNESPKTCDFKYDTDYGFGRNAMKFEAMDGSGNTGGENGVSYTWVIENGGNKAGAVVEHDFLKDGVYTVTMRAKVDVTSCECTKTKQVVMDRTGVEDLSQIGAAIFPNPTAGNYNIALTSSFGKVVKVEMMSLAGSVVKVVTASNNGLLAIDAGDLASGVYLVRISSGENMLTRKLTIQK